MWSRLVRFEDDDQLVQYGEPDISADDDILELLNDGKLYAHSYKGKDIFSLSPSPGPRLHVKTLLGLLEESDVPLLRCIAINYKAPSEFSILSAACSELCRYIDANWTQLLHEA